MVVGTHHRGRRRRTCRSADEDLVHSVDEPSSLWPPAHRASSSVEVVQRYPSDGWSRRYRQSSRNVAETVRLWSRTLDQGQATRHQGYSWAPLTLHYITYLFYYLISSAPCETFSDHDIIGCQLLFLLNVFPSVSFLCSYCSSFSHRFAFNVPRYLVALAYFSLRITELLHFPAFPSVLHWHIFTISHNDYSTMFLMLVIYLTVIIKL